MKRSVWEQAWSLLTPKERWMAVAVLGVAIFSAFSAVGMIGSVMPFLAVLSDPQRITTTPVLGQAYDWLGFQSTYWFLVALGVFSVGAMAFATLVQVFKTWVLLRFSKMRIHAISSRLLARYLAQPYEFFLDRHSGEMSTRILAESAQVVNGFYKPAMDLVTSSLTVVSTIAFLIWVDPRIALTAFGVLGGAYVVIYLLVRGILGRLGKVRLSANAGRFRAAGEALNGIKDVKILGREHAYLRRYEKPSIRRARVGIRVGLIGSLPQYFLQTLAMSGIVLLCLLLLDPAELAEGRAIGEILPVIGVFALAGQRMMPELAKVYQSVASIRAGQAAVESVYRDMFSVEASGALPRRIARPTGLKKTLTLDAVTYRYPNADRPGLHGIDLTIQAGQRVGLVGSTGAGKTTLADIVLGLLRPSSGRLLVDGQEVTDDKLRAWQRTLGYVPQDIFLTDASITENIALGVPPDEIDQERVERSARIAQLDTFIRDELPDGYDTAIGERGVRLSGGQRQRLGIARALYHDADLIVFDEATSALDNATEKEVMTSIDALPGDKTIILIAHRLSTVRRCDRIIVLDKGRLVGFGTWDELVETCTAFQRIADIGAAA